MCDRILLALVTGAALDAAAQDHAAGCPRCRAAVAALAARPAPVEIPPLPAPDPRALRRQIRVRTARRLGALSVAAAALLALTFERPPEPAPLPAQDPDLFALLDEVDSIPSASPEDPPGTEVLAMLDPLSPSPLGDATDPVEDLLTWSTP